MLEKPKNMKKIRNVKKAQTKVRLIFNFTSILLSKAKSCLSQLSYVVLLVL